MLIQLEKITAAGCLVGIGGGNDTAWGKMINGTQLVSCMYWYEHATMYCTLTLNCYLLPRRFQYMFDTDRQRFLTRLRQSGLSWNL